MILQKKSSDNFIKSDLMLLLQEGTHCLDYYKLKGETGIIYVLDEYSRSGSRDYYSIFFSFPGILESLKKFESRRWLQNQNSDWSYCPQWVYLTPIFIHDELKPTFRNEICKLLDGIYETDLSEAEQYVFRLWMKACEEITGQFILFKSKSI